VTCPCHKTTPLARVLDHLDLLSRLEGSGPQRRGPCPLHRGDGRGKSFSVHLDANVFQCFDAASATKGDMVDLWARVHSFLSALFCFRKC